MDKWFNKTYIVQIISVAIAILLWAIVRLNNDAGMLTSPDSLEQVPIQLRYDDTKFSARFEPSDVNLELRGKSADLLKIRMSSYQIVADASRLTAGKHTVKLTALDFPSGIDVQISPVSATVYLEKLKVKDFPVQVRVNGSPAEGFDHGVPAVKPSRVRVSGTVEQIAQIDRITADVDLQGAAQNVADQAEVKVYDKNGKLMSLPIDPQQVMVTVPVVRHVKVLPVKIVADELPPPGYALNEITVSPKQIAVYAAKDVLKQLEVFDAIRINLESVTSSQRLDLSVPTVERISAVEPGMVKADVSIVPSETRKLRNVTINWTGLPEGWKVSPVNGTKDVMDLIVEGAPAVLNRVTAGQVTVTADLSKFAPGIHQVQPTVRLPEWVRLKMDLPTLEVVVSGLPEGETSANRE